MKHLTLKLHGTDPETLPIGSLSKYLQYLDKLYGGKEVKHLQAVEKGCACLKIALDEKDYPMALQHLKQAYEGKAPKVYMDAYESLLNQIDKDGYKADVYAGSNKIIALPSQRNREENQLLTQNMACSVKGRLYSVGGKDDSIPVRLEDLDGKTIIGETGQDLARQLGGDLFKHIHAQGDGEWVEQPDGGWSLRKIYIVSYQVIENVDAKKAFENLKRLGGLKLPKNKGIHTDILDNRS
ncbi:hypothetical protein [Vreelandella sp. H-I2]